jgi:serine/threonine protein kinase
VALKTRAKAPPRVGNFDLLAKIADGGMGSVYKARERNTGETVAVKVLSPDLATNAVIVKRFEREFRAASTLRHPNVVRGIDFGYEGDTPYLAMEFVDGPSLGARLQGEGRLSEAEAVEIIAQVGQALHAAHEQGLIHRDVKPDNILLESGGVAKLADLGLAKSLHFEQDLTLPNKGLGTPNFMAPEQFEDAKGVDRRCDVYSLGATLYMAVTGELPFRGRTPLATLKKKLANDYAQPRKLVPGLSARTDVAIRRAMNIDRDQRPATCLEFLAALTGSASPRAAPAAPGPDAAARRAAERRIAVRFPSAQHGSCLPLGAQRDHVWRARLVDVSAGGISLQLRRQFEPKTTLLLERKASDPGRRFLLVRVLWCRRLAPERYTLGCEFVRPLTDDEIKSLC